MTTAQTTTIPDVKGILDSLENPNMAPAPVHPDILTGDAPKEALWNDFLSTLNSEREIVGRKSYYIDCDLIDTIGQCDFNGHAKVNVVNAIIRTFLEANVGHLFNIRKKKEYQTIIEKYEGSDTIS